MCSRCSRAYGIANRSTTFAILVQSSAVGRVAILNRLSFCLAILRSSQQNGISALSRRSPLLKAGGSGDLFNEIRSLIEDARPRPSTLDSLPLLADRKNFKVSNDRYNVQFRWEMFNTFNHQNLGQPDNTVTDPTSSRSHRLALLLRA